MRLYALHDKKAASLSSFVVERSDAQASRHFAQAVLEPKSLLGKYADDFELVVLAEIHEDVVSTGEQVGGVVMSTVLSARQVLDLQPQPGSSVDPAQLQLMKEA